MFDSISMYAAVIVVSAIYLIILGVANLKKSDAE